MKIKLIIILIIIVHYTVHSQINQRGKPLSYDSKYEKALKSKLKNSQNSNTGVYIIKSIDKAYEIEKEEKRRKEGKNRGSSNYGKEVEINIDFFKIAQLADLDNGDEFWLLNVNSEDAEGYQFLFNKFYLPKGCKLFFYNEEKTMSLGAYTSENNREDNKFLTQYINGNSIYIELYIPSSVKKKAKLILNKAVYIFAPTFRVGPYNKSGQIGDCYINTICHQGEEWYPEIKSVALVLRKTTDAYWGHCSGALINKENNYTDKDKPYFLTANHCYQLPDGTYSDVKDWVFLFRHETNFCSSDGSDIQKDLTKSAVGSDILSRDNGGNKSEYLLLQLKNSVGQLRNYNVSYAGWTSIDEATTKVVGIHHPHGDLKKISISNKTPISADYQDGNGLMDQWKITWDEGVTAPGSSGSPVFNTNHKIIGQLQGGSSYCTPTYNEKGELIGDKNSPDYYGKFNELSSNYNSNYLYIAI